MPRFAFITLSFVELALLGCFGSALRAEQLITRTYNAREGLLADTGLVDILQDSRGFIWIATGIGISRFDGQQFQNYSVSDGLGYPGVTGLLETRAGEIWAATNGGGVARYRPEAGAGSRFLQYPTGSTPQTNAVNSIAEGPDGTIWAASDGGVFCMRREEQHFHAAFARPLRGSQSSISGDAVHSVFPDEGGALWIASVYEGLLRRDADGTFETWGPESGMASYSNSRFYKDHSGHLWLLTAHGALEINRGAKTGEQVVLRRLFAGKSKTPNPIFRMIQTRNGDYWISTVGGLMHFGDDGRRSPSRTGGLESETTPGLTEDKEGDLWVGVEGSGIVRVISKHFSVWSVDDKLAGSSVVQIFPTRDGKLLLLAGSQLGLEVQSLDGHVFRGISSGISSPWTAEILAMQDHSEDFWVAGTEGVLRFRQGRLLHLYGPTEGWPAGKRSALFEDHESNVWVSRYGLHPMLVRWRRSTNHAEDLTGAPGSPAMREPWKFADDLTGNLWIATITGGLYRYREGKFSEVPSPFPAGERYQPLCLHVDTGNRVWVGYTRGVLGQVTDPNGNNPRVKAVPFGNDSMQAAVLTLTSDREGLIYAGTTNGLYVYHPRSGRTVSYSDLAPVLGGPIRCSARDASGTLWFGTDRGLVEISRPGEIVSERPRVRITQARFRDRPLPMSDWGEGSAHTRPLKYWENRAEFSFSGFGELTPLRYRYRLEPQDRDWSAPTRERSVIYPFVPAGSYRFAVEAIDPAGNVSAHEASVAFAIDAPLWQRAWFIASLGLMVFGIMTLAYRWRMNHLLSIIRLRERIAIDLHDDIGSSLTQVAVLSEVARSHLDAPDALSGDRLARIADIARDATSALADCVWTIHPRHDSVAELSARMRRFGNDLLSSRDVVFHFEAESDAAKLTLDPDMRRQLFLFFKEGLNNVARHSRANRASALLRRWHSELELTVEDDGIGFNVQQENLGHGLRGMQARAQRLSGSLTIQSTPGAGTKLSLRLPVAPHSRNN